MAMYLGFLAAMFAAWMLDAFDVLFESNSEPIGVLIAATIIYVVGFVDDVRGLSPPAKVAGTVARRPRARAVRRRDVCVPPAVLRRPDPARSRVAAARHRAVAARHDPGDQPDRRPRRSGGRHRRDRCRRVLPVQPGVDRSRCARREEHRTAARDHRGRRVRRVPPVQLQSGAHLHGRRRSAAARAAARGRDQRRRWPRRFVQPGVRRPDLLLPRSARDPAADPRGADLRPGVRDLPSSDQPPVAVDRRQGPPPPSPDGSRPRPPSQRGDPVDLDAAAVGVRAVPDPHRSQPDVSPVRHRRVVHRAVHGAAPERPCPPASDRRTGRRTTIGLDGATRRLWSKGCPRPVADTRLCSRSQAALPPAGPANAPLDQ